jgi:CubicO group peptidase (beta-lactamase class C family)
MVLADEGLIALDEPIARWLPELASPPVVRTPQSPLDDVVSAERPITVEDILSFRAGWGFPSDFSLPAVVELFEKLPVFGPRETPDEWTATLAGVPMLRQPGEAWLYNTCSDIQGVLVARASKRPLPEFLAERIFEPLGMSDTGFQVPAEKLDRLSPYHGGDVVPAQETLWTEPPIFPSGGGGLVSTLADWGRFGRMLLERGGGLLSPESVRLMTSDHLTAEQRDASTLFLEGAGWGYGGAVAADGRYGWVGGTGTTAHIVPSTGTVGILLTQVPMAGPAPPPLMRRFWRYAFAAS